MPNYTETMEDRVNGIVAHLPYQDRLEISKKPRERTQFAPIYNQAIYRNLMRKEQKIGDYFTEPHCEIDINPMIRGSMVELIQQMVAAGDADERVLFTAVAIADKFLAILAVYHKPAPSLIELGFVSFLVACKLLSNKEVGIEAYISVINTWKIKHIEKADILLLEERVLKAINFEIQIETPIDFVERFEYLYDSLFDSCKDVAALRRSVKARSIHLCKLMLQSTEFLTSTPSLAAASALIATLNCTQHQLIQKTEEEVLETETTSLDFFSTSLTQIPLEN